MRGRLLLAGLGIFASLPPLVAQPLGSQLPAKPLPMSQLPGLPPPGGAFPGTRGPAMGQPPRSPGTYVSGSPVIPAGASFPAAPSSPTEPRPLPPSLMPGQASVQTRPASPNGSTVLPGVVETLLPYPEAKIALDPGSVTMKKLNGGWQVWAGQRVLKVLGDDEAGARDVVRVLHDLHPTEWAAIGSPRPVVEYGLTEGKPLVVSGFPKAVVPIDLRTVRVEPVKGVWCLRDEGNILFNFGLHKPDADQALAVVRRYGFNRIGMVGTVTAPALTYFYVALEADGAKPPPVNALAAAVQENGLARTGIPVPGLGYVGEMVRIDPRRVEVRRDGADWVVVSGAEVLARCGYNEGAARDAARVVQDGKFTELCRVGSAGLTFFLVNGRAPTRVPLSIQGRRYSLASLQVTALGQKWAVTEGGRVLFEVGSAEEGEVLVRVLKHFGFDQLCQLGQAPRPALTFLAKSR